MCEYLYYSLFTHDLHKWIYVHVSILLLHFSRSSARWNSSYHRRPPAPFGRLAQSNKMHMHYTYMLVDFICTQKYKMYICTKVLKFDVHEKIIQLQAVGWPPVSSEVPHCPFCGRSLAPDDNNDSLDIQILSLR